MLLQNKLDSKMRPPYDEPKNARNHEDSTVRKQSTKHTGNVCKIPSIATNWQTLTEPGMYATSNRKPFKSASSKQDTGSSFFKTTTEGEFGSLCAMVLRKAITHSSIQNQQSGSQGISKGPCSARQQ